MTLFDFKSLEYDKQVELLYKEGVYVGKRKASSQTIILFQLYGFYVEVFYSKYRRLIHHINYAESTKILDPYLDQIDVEEVVNIFS
jgi:hypothetical protein